MILVTGAAGFIGSAIVWGLNEQGIEDIIVSDKFHKKDKWLNLVKRDIYDWVDRENLFEYLEKEENDIEAIIHMGACSATTEKDVDFLMSNNYEYSKKLWKFCAKKQIKYIYASSAATYGSGELGYDDKKDISKLKPLNPYGYSKHLFDMWAKKQELKPSQWFGLKFFNVYGPNEYHKGRMASVIHHTYYQAKDTGEMKLFKSHKKEYKNGEQLRDFVYVKDVINVINFLLNNEDLSSTILNVGTGEARSFKDLAKATMESMGIEPNIEYIDMPVDIRDKYQYYTKAKMEKLKEMGYKKEFYSLEQGIKDYVQNYLMKEDKYL
ncbi:MAG: ADP-glyceromanno-heptose 6-epimerase [Fusobacteriota bacterium]